MFGYDTLTHTYIQYESETENIVNYIIKVDENNTDSNNIIDEGLLIGLIDSYSTFAGYPLIKNEKTKISLSMNIKIVSLGDLYKNNKYRMKVWIKEPSIKFHLFIIEIYDMNDNLLKKCFHLKKPINPRY